MEGFRTITANVLMAIVPVLEVSGPASVLPPAWLPYYIVGMALANVALRFVTDTPVGRAVGDGADC